MHDFICCSTQYIVSKQTSYLQNKQYLGIKYLGESEILRKATISFVISVCLSVSLTAWKNWAPTRRNFMKFDIWICFGNLLRKFKFNYNRKIIRGTLHKDQYKILLCLTKCFLKLEVFQTKFVETIKTHILCSITFFRKSCHLWDKV